MLDKPTTQAAPAKLFGLDSPGRFHAMVRKLLFEPLSAYRHSMAPRIARWNALAAEAQGIFGRDVLAAVAMRDAVRYTSYECNIEGRLPGAVCCDFMQRRLQGWAPDRVVRDLRQRSRSFAALPRRETVFRLSEAGLVRLYAARVLNWPANGPDGRVGDPASAALERIGGVRVPPGFRRAGSDGRADTEKNAACIEALATLLGERHAGTELVMVLVERAEDSPSHVVVCDLTRGCPGIFDPHYGFMSAASAKEADIAGLLANVAFRYEAIALVALQERP